ncbi:MAG: tetratricopeptide repeat protein [Planctomycetota bacterium]
MISSPCLTAEDVEDYTAGMLSGERAEGIRNHLEQCYACKQLVEEGTVHARLLAQLRDAVERDEVAEQLPARGPRNAEASGGGPESAGEARCEPSMPVPMPERIGQFHIKRIIATGGMGTVYEAVQEHPRRSVAVKVMKYGIASRSALRRFEYESQILGRLRHPGIAQVYEAGTHDDGGGAVPYFVMEYIPNARPITDHARLRKLSTGQRLQLFVQVCAAVHHGHQKGIIHRDLKPGNILVDSAGEVKIIDFGVARATDSDMTLTTLQTEVGQLVGTVQYMSPEQCEADPHDLDTRSDVYTLGVVLYELLCEKVPYDVSTVAVFEAARLIREQQPRRLSAIDRTLRGDLETVVLKALEKGRERRYQSSDELRRDIEHYLTGEPISARPPSVAYQLKIFARRNRALVGGVAAVFVVLVAKIIASTWLYLRADEARIAQEQQRRQAEEARAETAREAEKAKAINAFFNKMLASVDPVQLYTFSSLGPDKPLTAVATERLGRDVSVEEMMRWAVPRIGETFGGKPELEAMVRERIGMTFFGLGLYKEAEPQLQVALDLRRDLLGEENPDTLRSLVQLGNLLRESGEESEAEPLLRSGLERMRGVFGAEHPHTLTCARVLAMALYNQEKYDEAEPFFRRTLEVQERVLGPEHRDTLAAMCEWSMSLMLQRGRHDQAEQLVSKAYGISHRALASDDYVTILSEVLWGFVHKERKEYAAGEPLLRAALRKSQRILGKRHPVTLLALLGLADSLLGDETLEEQGRLFRQALADFRDALGDGHPHTYRAMAGLGRFLADQGRFDEAEELYRRHLDFCLRTLGEKHTRTLDTMARLANSLVEMGKHDEGGELVRRCLELCIRKFGEGHAQTLNAVLWAQDVFWGMEKFKESREIVARAIAAGPHPNPTARDLNTYAWLLLACRPTDLRKPDAALPVAEKAVQLSGGGEPAYLDTLARAYQMTGDNERAIETQQKAIEALPSADSSARCDLEIGMVRLLLHESNEQGAKQFLREATARRRQQLGEENPLLAIRLIQAAIMLASEEEYELAEPLACEALAIRRRGLPEGHWQTAEARAVLAGCLTGLRRYQGAEPLLLEAHSEMKDNPQASEIQKREALDRLAKLYEAWGRPEQAAAWRAKLPTSQPSSEANDAKP